MVCKLLATSERLSPAWLVQRGWHRPWHPTYKAEAATDAGFHVAAPKCCHFPQLAWDLDGLVEQDTKVPLVTQSPGVCHLAEEICWQDGHIAPLETWLIPRYTGQDTGTGERCVDQTRGPIACLQQGAQIRRKN